MSTQSPPNTQSLGASERLVRSLTLKWQKLNECVVGLYLVRESMFRKDRVLTTRGQLL